MLCTDKRKQFMTKYIQKNMVNKSYNRNSRPVAEEQEIGSLVERTMRASLRYLLAARSPRGLSEGE